MRTAEQQLARIVLAGFMGSGKTTVGRLLATRLGWDFADLDEVISAREALSVPQIFALHGEAAFRALEVDALRHLLVREHMVIALGGGAPETPALRDLLASTPQTVVVHLHAPFELLYDRCISQSADPDATARPLLTDRSAAAERYERRLPVYAELAQHRAEVAERSPQQVVDDILSALRAEVFPS